MTTATSSTFPELNAYAPALAVAVRTLGEKAELMRRRHDDVGAQVVESRVAELQDLLDRIGGIKPTKEITWQGDPIAERMVPGCIT